jgi:hypothetical protein
VNLTQPANSPVINRAENIQQYFGEASNPRKKISTWSVTSPKLKAEGEWLCKGEIHIDDFQEFPVKLSRGDRVEGHLESDEPISLQILSQKDYDIFLDIHEGRYGEEDDYSVYYRTPRTTDYDFSWISTINRTVLVVIAASLGEGESIRVTVQIKVVRS